MVANRTHHCGHIADINVSLFARARNICRGHNVSDLFQKHLIFVSAISVSRFAQHGFAHPRNIVSNNVPSFTAAFAFSSRGLCCDDTQKDVPLKNTPCRMPDSDEFEPFPCTVDCETKLI